MSSAPAFVPGALRRFQVAKPGVPRSVVVNMPDCGTTLYFASPDTFMLATDTPERSFEQSADKACAGCKRPWGVFRHRYHCAADGALLCDDCCPKSSDAFHNSARLCSPCLLALRDYNQHAKDDLARRVKIAEEATRQLVGMYEQAVQACLECGGEEMEEWNAMRGFEAQNRRLVEMMIKLRREAAEHDLGGKSLLGGKKKAASYDVAALRAEASSILGFGANFGGADSAAAAAAAGLEADGGGRVMTRRRTAPVYGIRSGVLTIRILELKHLEPLRKDGMLQPFVVVEAGVQSQTSVRCTLSAESQRRLQLHRERLARMGGAVNPEQMMHRHQRSASPKRRGNKGLQREPLDDGSGSLGGSGGLDGTVGEEEMNETVDELYFGHEQLLLDFDVGFQVTFFIKDDRTGIQISAIDDTTQPGVPNFLGISYINIRKLNVLLETATPTDFAKADQLLQKRWVGTKHKRGHEHDYEFDPDNFEPVVERATQTRVLNIESGERNGDAQVTLSYTFHAMKQDFSSRHSAAAAAAVVPAVPAASAAADSNKKSKSKTASAVPTAQQQQRDEHAAARHETGSFIHHEVIECVGCGEKDTPAHCTCSESAKLKVQEDALKKALRQTAGELRAAELERRRWRNERTAAEIEAESAGTTVRGGGTEQFNPYANLTIPKLHVGKRVRMESEGCCCCG